MGNDVDWTWKFTPRAADQFDSLDTHIQDRICSKLDEIVESEWRDPGEFLDPLTGGPFSKLRIDPYRLACTLTGTIRCWKSIVSNTEVAPTRLMTIEKPFSFSPWSVATPPRRSYPSVGA